MENQRLSTRALSLPTSLSHINTPKMEKGGHSSTINIIEGELTRREMKGKAPLLGGGEEVKGGYKRGIAIFDFVLRVCGIAATLAATITMGTADQIFLSSLSSFSSKLVMMIFLLSRKHVYICVLIINLI